MKSRQLTVGWLFYLRGRTLAVASLLFLLSGESFAALNISASPNPVPAGQQIVISIDADSGTARPSCGLAVNFGDGTGGWSGTCSQVPCHLNTTHTYSTPGTYTITGHTTNENCIGYQEATTAVVVECVPLQISTNGSLPNGSVGFPSYNKQIQATGGVPPYNFDLMSGNLPPGLNLSVTGLLSGTATQAGNYSFTIRATDGCPLGPQIRLRHFSLEIKQLARVKAERVKTPTMAPARVRAEAILPKPDLVVCITGGDFRSKPLGSVDVKGVVKNVGNADAGPFSVWVYSREWGTPSGWKKVASITGLIRGDRVPWAFKRTYTRRGTKKCTVWVDKENNVDEGPKNNNNRLEWQFSIGIGDKYIINPTGNCSNN